MGCGSNKNNQSDSDKKSSYQSIAEEKIGKKISCTNNKEASYVLCKAYKTNDSVKYLTFLVIDLKNNNLIYEPKIRVRKVNWISEYQIEVFAFTGIPTGEGTHESFIYDVQKGEKIIGEEL